MLHTIRKVEYVDGYKLALTFNDRRKKIVDLEELSCAKRNSVFYPFRDIEFFKSVKLDKTYGTVVWPNGVDLCPDTLYMEGQDA